MSEQERLLQEMHGTDGEELQDLIIQMEEANRRSNTAWEEYRDAMEEDRKQQLESE